MRQYYEFWLGTRLLTRVPADCIEDARMLAGSDRNVMESKDRDEPAHEFRIRLARANVRTSPIGR